MADVTMNSPTIPNITPATADLLLAWDASAAANGEFPISDLITLLGASFALLTGATFTGQITSNGILNAISANNFDNGTAMGPRINLGRNSSATPAPGYITITPGVGSLWHIWPDDSGMWRTVSGPSPTSANYNTVGTVIGTQTSSLDQKDVLEEGPAPIEDVLQFVAEGAAAVRRFQYKATKWIDESTGEEMEGMRPMGGEAFDGVIVDYAGRYGTDRDEAHPNGKSLNSINVTGDLLRAVAWLIEENATLAARVAALEGA